MACTPETLNMWLQLKSKKVKACTFVLSRDNKIEVEKIVQNSDPDAWKNFTSEWLMPRDQCRYGIYNVNMTLDMGEGVSEGVISKLAFLHWTPEGAGALSKMMSSQAKESFMKKLDGNLVELQFCERDEFEVRDLIGIMSIEEDIRTSGGRILTFENIKA